MGRPDHDLVSGIDQQREHEEHGGGRAARDDHAAGIDADPEPPLGIGGDGVPELGEAAAVGVVGLAGGERRAAGRHGCGRRREVGLADLEVDHVNAVALHREGSLHHLHGEEGSDIGVALRDPDRHSNRLAARWRSVNGGALPSGWNPVVFALRSL